MALHRIGTDMDRGKARDKVPPGQPGELWDLLPAANQQAIDSDEIPQTPLAGDVAYLIVHDQAMLDGNAALNLATFVSTWMDDYAKRLYAESYDKNMIDKDEYPETAAIEKHCTKMIAKLWNAPGETIGTSTIGSSEACMLAGLAFKRRWQHDRKAKGLPTDKPNLIMSSAVQVVWEKFCNYWEVEPRYVPITLEEPNLTPEGMLAAIDENTIGVVGILGVTYTGSYEPIKELAAALDELQVRTGRDVPLHVDAASGGMVAPFLQPDLEWDFRLTRVHSINTSGHKYGLVYPGLGWVVWRSAEYLPEDLIFHVSYLGGDMPTLALNFSRPGAQVLLQYYLFVRLGMDGYRTVHQMSQNIALMLSSEIGAMEPFELVTKGDDIPVFAWRMKDGYTTNWDLQDLSDRLRNQGWQIPAYPMPEGIADIWVMRIVIRFGMLPGTAELLLKDIEDAVSYLNLLEGPMPREGRTGKANRFTYS
ncbi:MAG: glutamate decarboxylase [Candidatus Nanopelagicales bacterium]|jgi:glutamate decarboxylase